MTDREKALAEAADAALDCTHAEPAYLCETCRAGLRAALDLPSGLDPETVKWCVAIARSSAAKRRAKAEACRGTEDAVEFDAAASEAEHIAKLLLASAIALAGEKP